MDTFVVPTGHRSNVFCATFVPNSGDSRLVTSAADGCVHLLDIASGHRDVLTESFELGIYCFKHCPDPNAPDSVGYVTMSDGAVIRFDLGTKNCERVLNVSHEIASDPFAEPVSGTDISFNPVNSHMLALGTSNGTVLFYDDRNFSSPLFSHPPPPSSPSVSGIDWSHCNELIINYCRGGLVEIDISEFPKIVRQWEGRENSETFLKEVALYPNKSPKYILSGGDCGNLFVWDRFGEQSLIFKTRADPYILNCVKPNPILPLIATSGIASAVSIWLPLFS